MYLKRYITLLYNRVSTWLQTAAPGTLPITGLLGLAIAIIGYYQIRTNNTNRAPSQQRPTAPSGHTAPAQALPPKPASKEATLDLSPTARAVRHFLAGIKRLTISVPGVIVQESLPSQLQEQANVVPECTAVFSELCQAADVYLLAHVTDDIGQALVSGALEAAGIIGHGKGQVKPHRLLFCSTIEGKNSVVRQLEPDIHVDAHPSTVESLQRFVPQLAHIHGSGGAKAAAGASNVKHAESLLKLVGL